MTINDYLDMEALDNILEQWAAATHMIAVVLDDEGNFLSNKLGFSRNNVEAFGESIEVDDVEVATVVGGPLEAARDRHQNSHHHNVHVYQISYILRIPGHFSPTRSSYFISYPKYHLFFSTRYPKDFHGYPKVIHRLIHIMWITHMPGTSYSCVKEIYRTCHWPFLPNARRTQKNGGFFAILRPCFLIYISRSLHQPACSSPVS